MNHLISKIKKWYRGKYIPPPENDPDSPIVIYRMGHYEKPFLANLASNISKFWKNNWQWALLFIATVALLVTTILLLIYK